MCASQYAVNLQSSFTSTFNASCCFNINAQVVAATPRDACDSLKGDVKGKVVLFNSGADCTLDDKARFLVAAGAVGRECMFSSETVL